MANVLKYALGPLGALMAKNPQATKEFFLGKPEKVEQLSRFSPEQNQLFNQLVQQQKSGGLTQQPLYATGSNLLQSILLGQDPGQASIEAPIMRQFREQIVPGIAERFSGLGAGAQSSSAFQQALGSAGAGLAESLAAMRAQRQTQALSQALPYAQAPFQQQLQTLGISPFENLYRPSTGGFLGGFLAPLAGTLGAGVGRAAFGMF